MAIEELPLKQQKQSLISKTLKYSFSILIASSIAFWGISCKGTNGNSDPAVQVAADTTIVQTKLKTDHTREVTIEKVVGEQSAKNDWNFSFKLQTNDTLVPNLFTNVMVEVEVIKQLNIFRDDKLVQEIGEINEIALYYPEGKQIANVKLEDRNEDGFLDLWLEFSPSTREYDMEYLVYLFDVKKRAFSQEGNYFFEPQ